MKTVKYYYVLEFEQEYSNEIKLVIKDLIIQELNGSDFSMELILSQINQIKQDYITKLQFYTIGWNFDCDPYFLLIKELKTVSTFSDYLINNNSYKPNEKELISKIKYSSSSSSTTFWEWYNNAN